MKQSNLNQAGLEAAAKKLETLFYSLFSSLVVGEEQTIAKAAIAAYLECVGDGWRNIESAPKRGECLLRTESENYRIGTAYRADGGLKDCYTHWQSLPQPPTTGDSR